MAVGRPSPLRGTTGTMVNPALVTLRSQRRHSNSFRSRMHRDSGRSASTMLKLSRRNFVDV